jgi:hypothetical protein
MDIFLATGQITKDTLFLNGLHQNSLTLYSLFESFGYRCHCLTDQSGAFLDGYRSLEPETYVQNQLAYTPCLYIEIGTAFDAEWRGFLRRKGVRVVKLLLGNVLHIDLESTHLVPGTFFYHHVIGNYDEIWTSPHYTRNKGYIANLYRTPCRIVPYVWAPTWIEGLPRFQRKPWTQTDIVVAEPNISFQKHCLYPFLLVEAFAERYPEWKGRLILQNTERFQINGLMQRLGRSSLKDRIVGRGRQPLATILDANPSAAFISHQVHNEYNYMTLELLYLGYPVLHNSEPWKHLGVWWDEQDWFMSLDRLRQMLDSPVQNKGVQEWYPATKHREWLAVLNNTGAYHTHTPPLPLPLPLPHSSLPL